MKGLLLLLLILSSSLLKGERDSITINDGSGNFWITTSSRAEPIQVYYHKPIGFDSGSSIVLVIPGAGRDGDEYRDAWIESSEKFKVLVLSPVYPEDSYDFGMYHMGGTMKDFGFKNPPRVEPTSNGRILFAKHDDFSYTPNPDKSTWLFRDFDLIFSMAREALRSKATSYDIFGHSAGGQILHRLSIFYPESKAKRILASNSGFYTLPISKFPLPFGLKEFEITKGHLKRSLEKNLVLFVGELDNENETKGTRLRTPMADLQGLHRLERAHHYMSVADSLSKRLDAQHNWSLELVPGVGHDFRKMSIAAAEYLYGSR